MKEFKSDSALSRFGRDQRERRPSTERGERGERATGGQHKTAERSFAPRTKRASYNPHFTEENRPYFETKRPTRTEGGYGAKRSDYGSRKQGSSFTEKRFGDKPARGGRNFERGSEGRSFERGSESRKFEGRSFESKKYDNRGKMGAKRFQRDDKPKSYPKYDANKQVGEMRLNRYIAQSGICSRREADDFIQAGLVTVNGEIVTELGSKVMPGDVVKFNDSKIEGEKKVYLVLNKPKGYVTSLDDPHADKTVMELVKGACSERIYPVGRLDKNSLGLLLFTNDGDMTKQLTHPSYQKKKIYQVTLDKPLTRADMEQIAEGVVLEDGEIHADEISYVNDNKKEIGIEIHSGRNRIVRRIFEYLGYTVQKLDRVYYAGLTKKNLKRGGWRFLTREEVERLKSGRYE